MTQNTPTPAQMEPQAVNPVDATQVVHAVVDTVQAHPDIPPPRAASVIASVLAGLADAQPAIFAVSRAGPRTQAQVSLGLGLAEVIVSAFLRRRG